MLITLHLVSFIWHRLCTEEKESINVAMQTGKNVRDIPFHLFHNYHQMSHHLSYGVLAQALFESRLDAKFVEMRDVRKKDLKRRK